MLLGYARVSTANDQSTAAQARALRDAGTAADMARLYGVSQPIVSRIVADARAR